MKHETSRNEEHSCAICGDAHFSTACTLISINHHIKDKEIPSKARLSMPDVLRFEVMSDGSFSVISNSDIEKGTEFGPFEAKQTFTLNPQIAFPLKLFLSDNYFSEYYLDTLNENECNWMMFVQPAFNLEEQNLICYQRDCKIYYVTAVDIKRGEALKVWYAPLYAKMMNKELLTPEKIKNIQKDLNSLLKRQQKLIERDVWTCKFCNLLEKDVTKFATHISDHYSMQVRKACTFCKATFMTRLALKKHLRIVHAPLPVSGQSQVQWNGTKQRNKDIMLGGPLLNEILTDSMDNTNLLLPQSDLTHFDIQNIENQNMLLDNDSLNLGMENLICADDNFNFDIDDGDGQHVCDICLKPFNKLKQLVQHLQMHTGKYTCPQCLIIFSRNENLKSHKCNLTAETQQKCPFCDKTFPLKKYLSRHIQIVHQKRYECQKCGKNYHSEATLRDHHCGGATDPNKERFPCMLCDKVFHRESYMKKHLKIHDQRKAPEKAGEFICDVCAKPFQTWRNLQRHLAFHFRKRAYACTQCDKHFTRDETLRNHISSHHSSEVYACKICQKTCKSKKYLLAHMTLHTKNKKHECEHCEKKFFLRSNLAKHVKNAHSTPCSKSDNEVSIECYKCPICAKMIKLRSSLSRHLKNIHGQASTHSEAFKKQVARVKKDDTNSNKEISNKSMQILNNNLEVIGRECLESSENRFEEIRNNVEMLSQGNLPESQFFLNGTEQQISSENSDFNLDKISEDYMTLARHIDALEKEDLVENDKSHQGLDFNNLVDLDLATGLSIPDDLTVDNRETFKSPALGIPDDLSVDDRGTFDDREVCLSMPELDADQNITLGDNAFILENGTIVEPLDQGNFVVYILDKQLP